jgi:CO/xanthine dehydrogenase Mo-binding subunit
MQQQTEGNVVQTVSRTLKEEVSFDRSRVTSLDWASYPIPASLNFVPSGRLDDSASVGRAE